MTWSAVVLAGGAGARFGGADKLAVIVAGRALLDWTLTGVVRAGCTRIVCVGPRRPTEAEVTWCREDPPGGGPLAGLAAGVSALAPGPDDLILVTAGDQPLIGGAVPTLVAALPRRPGDPPPDDLWRNGTERRVLSLHGTAGEGVRGGTGGEGGGGGTGGEGGGEVAVLVDVERRRHVLAAVWRGGAVVDRLHRLGPAHGLAVRAIYDGASIVEVADSGGWAADVDTPGDLDALARRLG